MHLVYSQEDQSNTLFYQKRSSLTRPDSLPFIFKKLRINHNLTKKTFAAKFGVSEDYVREIENGSKFPSLRYCLFCAKEFEANPYWVKTKWSKEVIERFSDRLNKKLGLEK